MKHLQSYIVHYAAVIAGVCAVLAKINPALLGPQGTAIIGAATAGIAIANALGVKPETVAKVAVLLLLAMPLGMLSGCATVGAWFSSPQAGPVIQAAVDVAVATAEQKGVQAAQINSIAKQALKADSGASATLATVAALANAQIAKLNLPPQDIAAANILEVALGAAIQAKIGNNPNLALAQAALAQVLQDAIAATGG